MLPESVACAFNPDDDRMVEEPVEEALSGRKPRAAASFDPGRRTRWATRATARSRAGERRGSIALSMPQARRAARIAQASPCATAREISKAPRSFPPGAPETEEPRSTARICSIASSGSFVMLAMVRFRTFPPSRQDSRIRIVGGEPRFGTVSIACPCCYHIKNWYAIKISNNYVIIT